MGAAAASTGIRFFATGDQLVKKTFDELGDSGKKMWAGIASGKDKALPGMQGLSNAANELRGGMQGLIGQAGPAGSVLAGFGPWGVAAAAGVAALTLSVRESAKAMEDFASIGEAAAKIGVSTDALQEYRFVVEQTGGTIQDADAALKSFNDNFGLARAGSERQLRWFKMLGFEQKDLQQVREASDLLPEVTKRIGALQSESEKGGIAEKLGIGALLPAIRETNGNLDELIAKARESGLVIERDQIEIAKKASDEFKKLSTIIDVNLKSAFVDIMPALLTFVEHLAVAVRNVTYLLDRLGSLDSQRLSTLQSRSFEISDRMDALEKRYGPSVKRAPDPNKMYWLDWNAAELGDRQREYQQLKKERDDISAAIKRRVQSGTTEPGGNGSLGGKFDTAGAGVRFDAAIRKARDQELAAQAQAAKTIDQRLGFELERLKNQRATRNAEIDRQVKEKELTEAQGEQIKIAEQATRNAEEAALRKKAAKDHAEAAEKAANDLKRAQEKAARDEEERLQQQAEYDADMMGLATDLLRVRRDYALTEKERLALALAELEQSRKEERTRLQRRMDRDKTLSDEQRSKMLGEFDKGTGAMRAGVVNEYGGDTAEFMRRSTYDSLHDAVRAAFEDNADFLDSFFTGIAKRFKEKLADEVTDELWGMFSPAFERKSGAAASPDGGLISSLWGGAKYIGSSVSGLFGFASGSGASGVPTGVPFKAAEHGTEMMLIGSAGRVFDTQSTAQMLTNAMIGGGSGAGSQVKQTFQVDMRHALVTERLLKQFERLVNDSRIEGERNAVAAVRSNMSDWQADKFYTG